MTFDFNSLESPIHRILSAPNTDLTTISAKSVRRQLSSEDPSMTPEFLRQHKKEIDAVIGRVFESINSQEVVDAEETEEPESRKRKQDRYEEELGEEEADYVEAEEAPLPKKAKKASKSELSDAELARQLSDELNGRSRRTSAKPAKARGSMNGAAKSAKRGGRTKKSAETVDSDGDSLDSDGEKKTNKAKKKSSGGGAKGGFAKEYILSEPLAGLLKVDKLSRPQVVKQLWVHIKDNELQNPSNKREIMCDPALRAVFGVDKIDMFKMNKVLGQ
ncbi:hypothetical protein H0H87_008663 [Tephrocybe sp. NHM501043]|nr:hypothetical protein H0H87_008663 [Tephrocybe sp. NHM501043]